MHEFVTFWVPRLFGSGLLLSILWVIALAAAQAWKHTWNWIDDGDNPILTNPIIGKIMRWRGCEFRDRGGYGTFYWRDKDGAINHALDVVMTPVVCLFFLPLAIYLSLAFYPIVIAIGVLALLARAARFARRHKKLFDKHVKDPLAHKMGEQPPK